MSDIYKDLKQLGITTALPQSPDEAQLERVSNPQVGTCNCVRFTAPEFTSLCSMTGQPDFAHLVIDYGTSIFARFQRRPLERPV
jgi:7-cyano-7-deazaguanine reductase